MNLMLVFRPRLHAKAFVAWDLRHGDVERPNHGKLPSQSHGWAGRASILAMPGCMALGSQTQESTRRPTEGYLQRA